MTYDHRIEGARHFARVIEKALEDFTAEVERAADLLDRAGGRHARRRLLKSAEFAVGCLAPLENSLNGFGYGDVEPVHPLRNEADRLHALMAATSDRKGKPGRKAKPTTFKTRTGQSLRLIVNDAPIPCTPCAPTTGGDHAA